MPFSVSWQLGLLKTGRMLGPRVSVLTAIPVVCFAFIWQGGDLERDLAMFPALFLALAIAISAVPDSMRLGIVGLGVIFCNRQRSCNFLVE